MKASALNLFDAVDDQRWDHGGRGRSKVSQGGLRKETIIFYVYNRRVVVGRRTRYLCVSDGGGLSWGVAGQRTEVTAFWMSHDPAVLAAEIKLAELGSSSTGYTELGLDYLKSGNKSGSG